jgi:mono/diheme cytochrome c family protein
VLLSAGANPPVAVAQNAAGGGAAPAKPDAAAEQAQRVDPANADKVTRGRYIVENVAVCWRCHSPVDHDGNRDHTRWLLGGPVTIRSTVPVDDWAIVAPRLAGSPPGTDAEFVHLLMTGISRTGTYLRQPMPQFRMSQADAEAVLAYLKSLGTHAPAGTR